MILHGRNILLLAGGTAIAAAKSCELQISADVIPVASPTDGQWEDAIPGRKSWKASCSHLVTNITDPAAMVGTQVMLRMQVSGDNIGMPLGGMVSDVTTQSGTLSSPNAVVWDTTNKIFLGRSLNSLHQYEYYEDWEANNMFPDADEYNEAVDGTLFNLFGAIYRKAGDDLIQEALQGTAIVKDWKVTATLENLAAGSFQFQGVGALTNPTT
jgi:hypothetical protein